MTDSAKVLKKLYLKALHKYWGYRPKAKTGIEYTLKQIQYQESFLFEEVIEIETLEGIKPLKVTFMGYKVWAKLKIPEGADAITSRRKDHNVRTLISIQKDHIMHNMGRSFGEERIVKSLQARPNGVMDVNPKVLNLVYDKIQDIIPIYYSGSTESKKEFNYSLPCEIPLNWLHPGESKDEKVTFNVRLLGKEACQRMYASSCPEYAALAISRNVGGFESLDVLFRPDRIRPNAILHELTHLVQFTNTKARGHKSLSTKPIGPDQYTSLPVEFQALLKDRALEVLNHTIREFEHYKESRISQKNFPEGAIPWDVLLSIYQREFNHVLLPHAKAAFGDNRKVANKFISECYNVSYTQLVNYAKRKRIPGFKR